MSTVAINAPCIITSRLQPGVAIGESTISIRYAKKAGDNGRTRYQYALDLELDGKRFECIGDDIQSGCQGGDLRSGLESLLGFLSACGESYDYAQRLNLNHTGDDRLDLQLDDIDSNANLFPKNVAEWCYQNQDELVMLLIEVEENKDCIVE